MGRLLFAAFWVVTGCSFDSTGSADEPADPAGDPPGQQEPQSPIDDPDRPDAMPMPTVPTAFRMTTIELRDPHLFLFTGGFGGQCGDITDDGNNSVNAQIADALENDADDDGFVDRSIAIVFHPFTSDLDEAQIEILNALCTAPVEDTTCVPQTEPVGSIARNVGAPACDLPPAATTSGYAPAIDVAVAPCFSTDPVSVVLDVVSPLPLADAVVAATISPDGESLTGVLRGFITEEDADVLELGTGSVATIASRVLPGGEGACADHDARDVGPGGLSGWYVYFNFTAEQVEFDES